MATKKEQTPTTKRDLTQVKGIFMLIVVMSAVYSIATIVLGTGNDLLPKILVSPLGLWVACELTKRFAR